MLMTAPEVRLLERSPARSVRYRRSTEDDLIRGDSSRTTMAIIVGFDEDRIDEVGARHP